MQKGALDTDGWAVGSSQVSKPGGETTPGVSAVSLSLHALPLPFTAEPRAALPLMEEDAVLLRYQK